MNSRPRILVAESEEASRHVLQSMLCDAYDVRILRDGESVLKTVLLGETFDLVLLEQRLPDIDSLDLLRRIREANPHLAIVMVTEMRDVWTPVEAIRLGAADYVVKPFHFAETRSSIQRVLADNHSASPSQNAEAVTQIAC